MYSEPHHSLAFGACDDRTIATKLGLYGLHLELRNKIAIHMFLHKSVFLLHGDFGVHWDTQGGVHCDAILRDNDRVLLGS